MATNKPAPFPGIRKVSLPGKPYVVTVACQKGGVGKSTTSLVLAYLLSAVGYKVLLVDADQQGNSSETCIQMPIRDFRIAGYQGLLYAMQYVVDPDYHLSENHPKQYLWQVTDNLTLMPADERLGYFVYMLIEHKRKNTNTVLLETLQHVWSEFDVVVIDTAPALSPMFTNALMASDAMLAVYQPEKYCFSAMFSLFENLEDIRKHNPKLQPLGILTCLMDGRRSDMHEFIEMIQEDPTLGKHVFKTQIERRAPIGRLAYAGFKNNPELKTACRQYIPFVKELLARAKKS